MANKKITDLNEATTISGTDWLVMVDVANDETKKIHANQVGGNIPIQDTAPLDPEEDDLWIDTSEPEEMQEAIVNEYSESTNETYSCDYANKYYGGVVLYDDNTGTAGQVTLSENTSNFTFIEVYYQADNYHNSTKTLTSVSNFCINIIRSNPTNHYQYIFSTNCSFSGDKINQDDARNTYITDTNTVSSYGTNPYIKIYKVIGYK